MEYWEAMRQEELDLDLINYMKLGYNIQAKQTKTFIHLCFYILYIHYTYTFMFISIIYCILYF